MTITGRFGDRTVRMGTKAIGPDGIAAFTDTVRVANPRLWSPQTPNLYDVSFTVRVGGRKVAGYSLRSGIRSIKVSNGRLVLNGQFLNARGVGLHEDSKAAGFAIDNARREQLANEAKALGATVLRTHYPLHPYTHELADRLGLLIWSEIPVYSVKTEVLKEPTVRRLAVKELSRNIEANENHASVMLWSIGNELSSQPGPVQTAYIAAATKFAKEMDPTRPVGLAVAAYPSSLCQAEQYRPIDVLGFNDYFGWYPGPSGQIFDRTKLSGVPRRGPRLLPGQGADDHRVRRRGQPRRPDRGEGHVGLPAGLRELPPRRVRHQAVAQRRDLLGAQRVLGPAGWEGGNPRPASPLHQKGLVTHDGVRKPAWADIQRWYSQTPQIVPTRGALIRRRTGRAGSAGLRVRTRRRPGSASLSWPERSRLSDWIAKGSGIPPDGDVFGLSETRSLPPPPVSSSSSGDHVEAPSERRNIRNRAPPSTRATRWRTPKITSNSASEDIAQRLPLTPSRQTPCSLPSPTARRVDDPLPAATTRSWPTPRSSL